MGRADKRGLSEQCGQYQRALAMERRLLSSFYTLKRRKALKPDSKIKNFYFVKIGEIQPLNLMTLYKQNMEMPPVSAHKHEQEQEATVRNCPDVIESA